MKTIWNEKYRPKEFGDVIGQDTTTIQTLVEKDQIPHLLFTGPAGTGKTTIALIIANKVFGEDTPSNFMELNASDERGIDIVRNKIKHFALSQAMGTKKYKIILLDEADALTHDSQTALRRIMETYHSNCRFILTGNYLNKIIEPIRSRCMAFEFGQLSKEQIKKRLIYILKQEKVEYEEDCLDKIINISYPDLRRTINLVQKTAISGKVTIENLKEPETLANFILEAILNRQFNKIRELVIKKNPDLNQLVLDLYHKIIDSDKFDIKFKKKAILILADCAYKLSFVADKEIQFASCCIQLIGGIE